MLDVRDLTVSVSTQTGEFDVVSSVSFSIRPGEILGLVGESGCGKSMTSLAVMGLLPRPQARIRQGNIAVDGTDVTRVAPHARVARNCGAVAMIFQEPMTSLNPVMKIGDQIVEAVSVHDRLGRSAARARARELLEMVRIADAQLQLDAYPHELSGGMRQRVMIAIALACKPQILIADEPTTALDVTVQSQILGLVRELCDTLSMGVLFITHDLGVVAELADKVAVMYAGRIVEAASVDDLFARPAHPYTGGLLACIPDPQAGLERLQTITGQAPRLGETPRGCAFAPRCGRVMDACPRQPIDWTDLSPEHGVRCLAPLTPLGGS